MNAGRVTVLCLNSHFPSEMDDLLGFVVSLFHANKGEGEKSGGRVIARARKEVDF